MNKKIIIKMILEELRQNAALRAELKEILGIKENDTARS